MLSLVLSLSGFEYCVKLFILLLKSVGNLLSALFFFNYEGGESIRETKMTQLGRSKTFLLRGHFKMHQHFFCSVL